MRERETLQLSHLPGGKEVRRIGFSGFLCQLIIKEVVRLIQALPTFFRPPTGAIC